MPCVPGFGGALARVLRGCGVRVALVPARGLGGCLAGVRDGLDSDDFPGVVYKIPCEDCEYVYIGETGNYKRRLRERFIDVKNKKAASNALAEHVASTGHDINWDNACIIATERKLFPRLHMESLAIQTTAHTLNRNIGTFPPVYVWCLQHVMTRA